MVKDSGVEPHRPPTPKVKICGLSRLEDIDAANRALPDYIGFVFAPSRRRIDEVTAIKLKERLSSRIKVVGVFVNQDIEVIANLYVRGVIDIVQLHGDEDEDYIDSLKDRYDCPVIKAVGVGEVLPPLPVKADYLLFDTLSQQRGGTGVAFDWGLLRGYTGLPYFLAGGLNFQNVIETIFTICPYCVDVSSGVETNGLKDADKIYEFVHSVRDYR